MFLLVYKSYDYFKKIIKLYKKHYKLVRANYYI